MKTSACSSHLHDMLQVENSNGTIFPKTEEPVCEDHQGNGREEWQKKQARGDRCVTSDELQELRYVVQNLGK